jgi:hypothetical protein
MLESKKKHRAGENVENQWNSKRIFPFSEPIGTFFAIFAISFSASQS